MGVIRKYAPGKFSWTDLGTTDVAGAKKFYRGLFGWTMKDFPMGPGDEKYSMMRVGGKDVCALYPMVEEQKKMKAPPAWLPYITVKNAAATVKKAKTARGKVISPAMDVMGLGRSAILMDPTGAAFALWQPLAHRGAGLDGKPGTVCWHDLNTPKSAAAGKFYTKVVGWTTEDQKYDGNAYHLFKIGRKSVCGMWPSPMKNLPTSWVTYFQVASCAKSVAKVKRLGGRVLMGTTPVPGMCKFAIVKDPQGAAFGLLEFED